MSTPTRVRSWIGVQSEQCRTCAEDSDAPTPGGPIPIIDLNLDILCVRYAIENGLTPYEECDLTEEEIAQRPQLTETVVASAFRELPLPASQLVIEPPNGRTLVNFETNFYTEAQPLRRTLTLLGQRVDLAITPAEFAWSFGDGGVERSTSPGAAYPALEITHDYLARGRYAPRVDTTYTADYRVNGGPWRPVPGSVTIPGPARSLQAVTARPKLVG